MFCLFIFNRGWFLLWSVIEIGSTECGIVGIREFRIVSIIQFAGMKSYLFFYPRLFPWSLCTFSTTYHNKLVERACRQAACKSGSSLWAANISNEMRRSVSTKALSKMPDVTFGITIMALVPISCFSISYFCTQVEEERNKFINNRTTAAVRWHVFFHHSDQQSPFSVHLYFLHTKFEWHFGSDTNQPDGCSLIKHF